MIKNNDFWSSTLEVLFTLLCICIGFLMGSYSVKAEVIDTHFWDINLCGQYTGHQNESFDTTLQMYKNYLDYNIGDNTSCNGFVSFTNGSTFSNSSMSGIIGFDKTMQINGLWLTDAYTNNSYACAYYDTNIQYDSNSGIRFYNFICDNLGTISGNGTRISFNFTHYGGADRHTFYISKFYKYNSSNKTNQDIANNTGQIQQDITDDSIDTDNTDSSVGGFSSSTNSNMTNTPVSSMISLPITFLTGVNNALSSSCTNVNYIELFDYQLVLPCLNLSQRLGSVWTIIDTIFSCMLIFSIGKSLVSTFARLSDMDTNIMYECYANGTKHRGESFDD